MKMNGDESQLTHKNIMLNMEIAVEYFINVKLIAICLSARQKWIF